MVGFDLLQGTRLKSIGIWDCKRFIVEQVRSKYSVISLLELLNEQTEKKKLSKFPEEEFGILGVSNNGGMFDAYTEKGKNINQPYKIVKNDFIAYNPYRVNVGSIGIKKDSLKNEYISNAYVVFSTKKDILPDYLFILMQTPKFNQLIRDNTTGSVRQTLSFENLCRISIPVPQLEEQKRIVQKYQEIIARADEIDNQAEQLQLSMHTYFDAQLGIVETAPKTQSGLHFIHFADIDLWGAEKNQGKKIVRNKKYPMVKLETLCSVGSGGTPDRQNVGYYKGGNIPWVKTTEVVDDYINDTEEKITQKGLENSSAKLYEKGSLLIAMYGQGKTRGRTAKLEINAATNQACAVLHEIDNSIIETDYLWFYFQNEYDRIRELAYGNNQPNLNAGMIKSYPVVLPPLSVQEKMVSQINKIKSHIKDLRRGAAELRQRAKNEFEGSLFE